MRGALYISRKLKVEIVAGLGNILSETEIEMSDIGSQIRSIEWFVDKLRVIGHDISWK